MSIVTRIARAARKSLGRPARRIAAIDWQTTEAVRAAAIACGLDGADRLAQWISGAGQSLTDLAGGLVARYVQAFGPVENLIDVGAHLGLNKPMIVAL